MPPKSFSFHPWEPSIEVLRSDRPQTALGVELLRNCLVALLELLHIGVVQVLREVIRGVLVEVLDVVIVGLIHRRFAFSICTLQVAIVVQIVVWRLFHHWSLLSQNGVLQRSRLGILHRILVSLIVDHLVLLNLIVFRLRGFTKLHLLLLLLLVIESRWSFTRRHFTPVTFRLLSFGIRSEDSSHVCPKFSSSFFNLMTEKGHLLLALLRNLVVVGRVIRGQDVVTTVSQKYSRKYFMSWGSSSPTGPVTRRPSPLLKNSVKIRLRNFRSAGLLTRAGHRDPAPPIISPLNWMACPPVTKGISTSPNVWSASPEMPETGVVFSNRYFNSLAFPAGATQLSMISRRVSVPTKPL